MKTEIQQFEVVLVIKHSSSQTVEEKAIQQMIRELGDRQLFSSKLIGMALLVYTPGHPFLRELCTVQDDILNDLRNLIELLPDIDEDALQRFDEQLHHHRVTLILALNGIKNAT